MIKIVKGDLLKVEKGIIVHQVNCQKTMGSGIALSIRKKYPSHYIQYLQTEPQLGQIIITPINQKLFIIGLYGQDHYGRSGRFTDYFAFESGCESIEAFRQTCSLPVYFPFKIGCNRGGGDWKPIYSIIERTIPSSTILKLNDD